MLHFAPVAKAARKGIVLKLVQRPYGLGAALTLFVLPIGLFAQAIVEYALKSASSTLSQATGYGIAGCYVDSALFTCLGRQYPRTAILVVGVLGLLILSWLAGLARNRAR